MASSVCAWPAVLCGCHTLTLQGCRLPGRGQGPQRRPSVPHSDGPSGIRLCCFCVSNVFETREGGAPVDREVFPVNLGTDCRRSVGRGAWGTVPGVAPTGTPGSRDLGGRLLHTREDQLSKLRWSAPTEVSLLGQTCGFQ